jgi:hypothetical protein
MKLSIRMALLLAATALAAGAQAQLKPGPRAPAPATAPAAAPAAPAVPSPNAAKEEAGRMAANGWLLLLDRRDWGTAWDASSAVFRQTVPIGNWMDAIPKLRQPMGALVDRTVAEVGYKTTLPGRPDGEYVTVIFVAKFDKREELVEELVTTVREADGKWRVTGYSTR